jgi:hypothetical protein
MQIRVLFEDQYKHPSQIYVISGSVLLSRTDDVGWTVSWREKCLIYIHQTPKKVLFHQNSSPVAMEVGTR